jgi:hypothetical protein
MRGGWEKMEQWGDSKGGALWDSGTHFDGPAASPGSEPQQPTSKGLGMGVHRREEEGQMQNLLVNYVKM